MSPKSRPKRTRFTSLRPLCDLSSSAWAISANPADASTDAAVALECREVGPPGHLVVILNRFHSSMVHGP